MLEIIQDNTWKPPGISYQDLNKRLSEITFQDGIETEWLVILKIEPYIDSVFVHYDGKNQKEPSLIKRFVFNNSFCWDYEDEIFFENRCLNNSSCGLSYEAIKSIFKYYSSKYPEWKLKRYYTKPFRMLDHIYHCMKKNTVKEILYKAELNELAANITDIDEINLLASRPSDIYDGISIRTLRMLNCRDGSRLLSTANNRLFIKQLQIKFPDLFYKSFNDAQCRYLCRLIEGELTVGEIGRLFRSRRGYLMYIWNYSQYELFLSKEKIIEDIEKLRKIDSYYKKFVNIEQGNNSCVSSKTGKLIYYLVRNREEYDRKIRRSNRKRNYDWQERTNDYVVRYPQTINDFCREATYMGNCLLTYVEAMINNDTTILFLRKSDDVNKPFITMEIYENQLMQAYHRFNQDCNQEEADWIKKYCKRHSILCDKFKFNRNEDGLF